MEVNWYCWVTVMSLVTNFHGCPCWPTLQPPLRPVTSKHELDSDESRKVLGSSVVTSVSVIMDHGNGSKTFLNDGIENPELKTNIIGSPGNLLSPDRYEFYTFDETGDLVKRLMTWDEIQGLIAGGDGDSLLGEASVPMYYSDLPDKVSPTHLTANDFQTSDIQGVHKVVESVQNVLKSELAASQSKIAPVAKPGLLSNAPNWSLFLPTLLDNAEDGSELNNLGILASPSAPSRIQLTSTSSEMISSTETTKANLSDAISTTVKEFIKKTEKPIRFKVTTNKPSMPTKAPFNSTNKISSYSTTERWPTPSTSAYVPKKPYSTSKYEPSSIKDEHWPSTFPTVPKKTFTSSKYGGYVTSNDHPFPTSSPPRRNSTLKYGGYSSLHENSFTTPTSEFPSTRKTFTTSKYTDQSTTNELFSSIASVLQQVTDNGKITTSTSPNTTNEKSTSALQYKSPTEATPSSTFDKIISMSQFKSTAEPVKHTSPVLLTETHKFTGFHQRPFSEFIRTSTETPKSTSTEKRYTYTDSNRFPTSEYSKLPSLQHNKYTPYRYKPTTDPTKHTTSEKISFTDNFNTKISPFSENHKTSAPLVNSYRPGSPFTSHKTVSPFPEAHKSTSTYVDSRRPPSSFPESQRITSTSYSTASSQFKSTTETTKYAFTEPHRITSSSLHTSFFDFPSSSRKPINVQDNFVMGTSRPPDLRYNFTGEATTPHSTSLSFKDTAKTTKIYESSTLSSSSAYTPSTSLKQSFATKPVKNKITYTKYTSKPESSFAPTINKLTTTSPASEKPLIRISTLRSTLMEQTTTKPEPLVTWISTSPLEDTPSKVSLFGVYDSDKLVTEQYVSSSNDRRPSITDFFRNTTTASTTTPTTSATLTTTKEPSLVSVFTELYTDIRQSIKQTLRPFSTSTFTRFPSNSIKNALSSIADVTRPVHPSEHPEMDAKTEPTYHSYTKIGVRPSDRPELDAKTEPTKITDFKSSSKTSTSQPYNYSSSETIMQRIPTINPPNKGISSTTSKASTKPVYMFTDAMKNITQIAVMLNKSNETATKSTIKNEYRNKVTHPTYETTKPLNAVFINDCITSLLSGGALKDNHTTESATSEHSHIHYYKLPASDQKENSLIYYYKLPPIPSQDLHSSKPTESSTAEIQYYKPEITDSSSFKTTSNNEYQKTTTQQRPTSDIIQDGISAVTNILLQTEGRMPNKEFTEFEPLNASRNTHTTENMMRTDEIELTTKNATKSEPIVVEEATTLRMTTAYKLQNRTATVSNAAYLPSTSSDNTTEFIELTSLDTDTDRPHNDTDAEVTTTETVTTDSTGANEAATIMATTVIGSDLRNEYLDDRNMTLDEDQDSQHYTSGSFTATVRSTTLAYTEVTKAKNPTTGTTVTSTLKPVSEKSTAKPAATVEKVQTSNNRSSTNVSSTTVEYVEVKLENKTKSEANSDESVPPSALRSPSNPGHKQTVNAGVPGVELHPAPHESMGLEASIAYLGDDVKRFVDFCNELSFKIWTTQTGKSLMTSRSIVISPFAALSTLAMIFLGARGASSGIMNDFLKLDDMVTFNPHQVLQNITESAINPKNIGVANSALVREIFSDKSKGKVLEFYKERLQQYYDTHVEEINFNSIGDMIRRRTNLLVKRQTQGKIQDYLKGSALVMKPPLAILTANIFQTDCELASTDGRDGEMYFVVRPSARQRRLVPIPAVVYRSGFLAGYEPGLDATAVTLNPESTVSTILVLPGQQGQVAPGDGLARLEQRLLESSYRRGAWSRLLRSLLFRPGLELQIPRFSHKSVLNLTVGLQKMGMEEIFAADRADLRGINGLSNELHLSDIVQVNMFSTCGENTVGARHHSETYPSSPQRVGRMNDIFDRSYLDDSVNNYYSSLPLNLRPRQARLPDNPRLRFDRPFLYVVRHNPTGMILYIGRFNPRLLP